MMQDIGLSLDEIGGLLHARAAAGWKTIPSGRLGALDARIAELQEARTLLAAALLCCYGRPATDCSVTGGGIDRRLAGCQDR